MRQTKWTRANIAPRGAWALGLIVGAGLAFSACSRGVDNEATPATAAESEEAATAAEGPEPDEATAAEPLDYAPPIPEAFTADAVVTSASWFSVLGYAGGVGFDGPLLDVSNDGSLWLVDGGDQPSILLGLDTQEMTRLPGVSEPANLSGNGEYVVYSSSEECAEANQPCDAVNDERHLLRLATGEAQDLGAVREPVLINTSGDVVFGLVGNPNGLAVKESVEWADGSATAIRLLFGELGQLPPSWSQAPRLYGMDGSGDSVLYTSWVDDDFIARDALYSILTPTGALDLVGLELARTLVLTSQGEIAEAGDVILFTTSTYLTSVAISDGSRRHYLLEGLDRFVATLRLAGDTALAVTTPRSNAAGPIEVIQFQLGADPFEQSAQVILRIPDPSSDQTPGDGGLRLHASADGTTLGVAVLIDDPDHPNGQSWLNVIVDLNTRPASSIIEIRQKGIVEEVADQQVQAPTDPNFGSSLSGYLASLLEVAADLTGYQAVLNSTGAPPGDLADLWRGASTEVASLDPPAEAREFDQGWRTLTSEFAEAFGELAAVSESTNSVARQQVADEFVTTSTRLVAQATSLDEVQFRLTLEALEGRDDPMAAYIVQVVELQQDVSSIIERILSALAEGSVNPDGGFESLRTAIDEMSQFGDDWALVEAPEDALVVNQARLRGFRDLESVFRDLGELLESNTEPPFSVLNGLDRLTIRSQRSSAAMMRLTADVLRAAG